MASRNLYTNNVYATRQAETNSITRLSTACPLNIDGVTIVNGAITAPVLTGESNTASNAAGADREMYIQQDGVNFEFRGLTDGNLINLTTSDTSVTIDVDSSITLDATNTIIGNNAGEVNVGTNNTFIGDDAGRVNTTGNDNTFIGDVSGSANTTGEHNTFIGYLTGVSTDINSDNTYIGFGSGGLNETGIENTFIGKHSGLNGLNASESVFIGTDAGKECTSNKNVQVGMSAGYSNTGYGCILIGNEAGYNNQLNNRLMIANSNTNTPLIDGIMSSNPELRTLDLNGVVTLGIDDTVNVNIIGNNSNVGVAGAPTGTWLRVMADTGAGFIEVGIPLYFDE